VTLSGNSIEVLGGGSAACGAPMGGPRGHAAAPEEQETGLNGTPQTLVAREVRPMPDRYRNALGKYRIFRSADCAACGLCVKLCPHGVHNKPEGYTFTLRPQDHRCIGPECADSGHYCIDQCPQHALQMARNPVADALIDARWSTDL
jgi:ferredoxin